jgi:hypothetical protein
MNWRGEFDCSHVSTFHFKKEISLGVWVKDLIDAEATVLVFSVRDPNTIDITLRFNSEDALQKFQEKHQR